MSKRNPRTKRPVLPGSEPREMDLIGLDTDGTMSLWDTGMVKPVSMFEVRDNGLIKTGHYVIEWLGHAITVHCGNTGDGQISVQFMCSRLPILYMPRRQVESVLLGKVLPDPKAQAELFRNLVALREELMRQQRAPHRLRGKIT